MTDPSCRLMRRFCTAFVSVAETIAVRNPGTPLDGQKCFGAKL